MQKRIPGLCVLSLLIVSMLFNLAPAGGSKTEDLEQKIYQISSLRAKIIDKIDQAVEMHVRLEHHLAEVRDEIRSEQIRTGVYSNQEAMQNLRIRYNLSLIQVLQAYIEKLDERITYFQNGNGHLKFLVHQIKDDIAIINTLKDMEIDHLTERINRVLDEFIPETKKPVFNAADIRKLPIQSVWEQTRTALPLNRQ